VNIGGTKVSICLGNSQGEIIGRKRLKISNLGKADKGLPKIIECIHHLLKEYHVSLKQIHGMGLALPGPLSVKRGTLIAPPNLPGWENLPIVQYFQEYFDLPIFMNNDANSEALAEWEFGQAKHIDNLVYLTMSTGVGGGIVIQKTLLMGKSDSAGEVGHFVLDPQGPKCPCGQRGCFEVFCGGGNIARIVKEKVAKGAKTTIVEEAGSVEKIDMQSIIIAMQKEDSLATHIWETYIERLAQGIGILLMVLNPDAIILGTIAMHAKELLMTPLLAALPRFSWGPPLKHCSIQASSLGDKIGDLGALSVAVNGLKGVH